MHTAALPWESPHPLLRVAWAGVQGSPVGGWARGGWAVGSSPWKGSSVLRAPPGDAGCPRRAPGALGAAPRPSPAAALCDLRHAAWPPWGPQNGRHCASRRLSSLLMAGWRCADKGPGLCVICECWNSSCPRAWTQALSGPGTRGAGRPPTWDLPPGQVRQMEFFVM